MLNIGRRQISRRIPEWTLLLWWLLLTVSVRSQDSCPALIAETENFIIPRCLKQDGVLDVNYPLLNLDDFSGLHVFRDDQDTTGVDVAKVSVTKTRLSYAMDYNKVWRSRVDADALILTRSLKMEMIWPLQRETGKVYDWTVDIECGFKTRQILQTTTNLVVQAPEGNPDGIPTPLPEITGNFPAVDDDKPVDEGSNVTFVLRIPDENYATPVHCGITTDESVVSHPVLDPLKDMCLYRKDGSDVATDTAACKKVNGDKTINFNVSFSRSENGDRILTASWNAVRPTTNSQDVIAFCVVRSCFSTDDPACLFETAKVTEQSTDSEEGQFLSMIWKNIKVVQSLPSTTTENPTENPQTEGSSGSSREDLICMKPAEIGALFGAPLGLILILIGTLLFLFYVRQKQTRRRYEDTNPIITVTEEPVIIRQPRFTGPGLKDPKTVPSSG